MSEQWEQFYKWNRFIKLYWFFFPAKKKAFIKKLRAAYKIAEFLEPLCAIPIWYGKPFTCYSEKENKMSKTINIKDKEISEDTIVEALKKHCGFTEDEPLKAGDVVRGYSEIRIIVGNSGNLVAYGLDGHVYGSENAPCWRDYKKIGTLVDFFSNILL